ncbi:protein ITPRID2-like [Gigantopelta aegis]|uniref:protein ITPRID2-like n=1 Tax=Gigantopelta aegis TaxID=1735272 RepID=UPI001B888CC6|nr:protein ITPRID2-like [Gigantopelta aegis]
MDVWIVLQWRYVGGATGAVALGAKFWTGGKDSGSANGPLVRERNTCLAPGAGNPRYTTDRVCIRMTDEDERSCFGDIFRGNGEVFSLHNNTAAGLTYCLESANNTDCNNQSNLTVQTEQPIKAEEKTGLTPKLVQALINKRDYLRLQVKTFQKSFPGFRLSRFTKGKPVLIDENVDVPESGVGLASNSECLECSSDGCHVMAVLKGEGHSDDQVALTTSGSAMATSEKSTMATSLGELVGSLKKKKGSVGTTATDAHDWSHSEGAAPTQTELTNGHKEDNVFEDDLPLGSEGFRRGANNLTKNTECGSSSKFPCVVDKRLKDLKESRGFTSFNSDTSVQTSGSTCSATSLDALLENRQVDPVQVLMNLGFGYSANTCHNMMRVPERFLLQQSHATGIDLNEILADYPELHRLVMKRTTSTRAGAWRAASKTLSSALVGVKTLSEMRSKSIQKSMCTVLPEREEHMSILHPDNQRELALRGFYSKCLNTNKTATQKDSTTDTNASAKRHMFSRSHIKHGWSLVESSEGQTDGQSGDRTDGLGQTDSISWMSVSTDDSKGRPHCLSYSTSMDSSEFSAGVSEPHSATASEVFRQFDEEIKKYDESLSRIGSERRRQVDGLMTHLIDDGEYQVTPIASKQTSLENSPVRVIESSPLIMYDPDDVVSRSRNKRHQQVTIVVHGDPDSQNEPPTPPPSPSTAPVTTVTTQFQSKVACTQALLTIVSTAMDRLSDSGSDYTVIGNESPYPSLDTPESSIARSDTVFSEPSGEELAPLAVREELAPLAVPEPDLEEKVSEDDTGGRHTGPAHLSVKFVDENENYPSVAQEIREAEMLIQKKMANAEPDLPRMGSVQSDSSGFGDADVSADTNTTDSNEPPRVGCLGSSSESVGTFSSSATLPSQQAGHTCTSRPSLPTSDIVSETVAVAMMQVPSEKHHIGNHGSDTVSNIYSGDVGQVSSSKDSQTFISWCFIPSLHTTNVARAPREENARTPVKSKFSSFADRSERNAANISWTSLPKSHLMIPRETNVSSGHGKLPPFSSGKHTGRSDNHGYSDDNLSGDEQSYSSASTVPWRSSSGVAFSPGDLDGYAPQYPTGRSRHFSYSVNSDSKTSLTEESDYSSVADSTVSCSNVELLEYRKLVRLINQPSRSVHGRRRRIPKYHPRKPIRDWTTLVRKKRIQEETRLLQHAVHKYKTEMSMCEAMFSLRYQAAFDDLSQEERDDIDAVQYLWSEIRQQILRTEQLLSARMNNVDAGNDFFSYLSTFNVLEKMIDLLKEQTYHQELSAHQDDEESQDHLDVMTTAPPWSQFQHPSPSCGPHTPPWGPQSPPWRSSVSEDVLQKKLIQKSMEELRGSLIEEIRQEMSRSAQQLNLDMQARDNEIHRLQLELMMREVAMNKRRPRASHPRLLRPSKQTIV